MVCLFFYLNSDPSYRNSEEMHLTMSFIWYVHSPLPTFCVKFTDSAERVRLGKWSGAASHYPMARRRWIEKSDENIWAVWVPKCHPLSGHFMDWQEMTTGCTLQFKPNPTERRIPKHRKFWRTFSSEQVSSSSLRVRKETKVPIFPVCLLALPYFTYTMQKRGGNEATFWGI